MPMHQHRGGGRSGVCLLQTAELATSVVRNKQLYFSAHPAGEGVSQGVCLSFHNTYRPCSAAIQVFEKAFGIVDVHVSISRYYQACFPLDALPYQSSKVSKTAQDNSTSETAQVNLAKLLTLILQQRLLKQNLLKKQLN